MSESEYREINVLQCCKVLHRNEMHTEIERDYQEEMLHTMQMQIYKDSI